MLMMTTNVTGQTYESLWKKVQNAQDKDLPQTAMTHLKEIEAKAAQEHAYGQLLKSTLLYSRLQAEVAPDSLLPAVVRLEQEEKATKDMALKAVYDAVLSQIYAANHELDENWQAKQSDYQRMAKEHPEVLVNIKTDDYLPFINKEKDSQLFGHDLLSVIGMELNDWQWLSNYYHSIGNCKAACLAAAYTINSVADADSLIAIYGDEPEACELAIRRYRLMDSNHFTAAEKDAWLEQSINRWGSWQRANVLRNERTELNNPSYQIAVPQRVFEVGKPQVVKLTQLRHLESLTMQVWRTDLKGDTKQDFVIKDVKKKSTLLAEHTKTVHFSPRATYEVFEDSLQLDALPAGIYILSFDTSTKTRESDILYYVSGLRIIAQPQPNEVMRYIVVDATTGQPVKDAKLRLSFYRSRKQAPDTETLTCNEQGEVLYDCTKRSPSYIYAYTDADEASPQINSYGRYSFWDYNYNNDHTYLYTDRSIYRPGQTVHVTALAWRELSVTDNQAIENRILTMRLRDANYKVVSEQKVTTDRYGKASAVFTLPTGKLNGRFTIQTASGSTSFRVEEYKRPTFQVEFDDYKESYQAGDTVHAKAKAMTYAGVPVQDAKVKYTVKRRVAFWWLSYSWYWNYGYIGRSTQEEVVNTGEATTAEDGSFLVDMPMVMPEDLGNHTMFYHFVVEADVTDQAGETHSGTLSLPLGNKPTALTCDLPQQVRSDQIPKVTFSRRNAAGQEISGKLRYRIDGGKWQEASANSKLQIANSQKLNSGEHRLEAICATDSIDRKFVVFGLDDKRPATQTHDWYYISHQQFPNDGSPVTLQVGSSDPNLHIVYSIYTGNQLLESGAVKKNAELINRKFTYKEEYGNGLLLTYAWVKNGVCYQHQQFIRRPLPDKQLRLSWETFRDRLTPGQQEQWTLKILKPDGTPADASMAAVLYDKSLDAITRHQWSLNISTSLAQPSTSWQWQTWGSNTTGGQKYYRDLDVKNLSFSSFDHSVLPVSYRLSMLGSGIMVRGRAMTKNAVRVESAPALMVQEDMAMDNAVVMKTSAVADTAGDEKQESQQEQEEEVQVRENLNETAFCYPTLRTDAEGVVRMTFTLPEALTTWRFMGIANTRDMFFGNIEGEAIAQKDVMIQPNMPRFVRMGDNATISARLFNTSEKILAATARIKLIDPATEQVFAENSQAVSLPANGTGSVTFQLQPTQQWPSLLICKMTVSGEGFSDGEQHYLPVLPDREYVTKTVPYTQHEPGIKTIDLQALFPQGTTQQKLTIEYTNNPAWLMVQSLPVIGQPYERSAIDQAASYYSNALAKSLLAQSPQVKGIFEQWKKEAAAPVSGTFAAEATLSSQLEKNQELKDLLLAETPWVNAADRESEQRQRMADFFDENEINNRLSSAVEKLKDLQNGDGSFSWYPGMEGSVYITAAVEEMLVRLQAMTAGSALGGFVTEKDVAALYDKAFTYMGNETVELVERMKKEEKKGHKQTFPSFTALRWLYICAIDGRPLSGKVKTANDYLIKLLKKDIKRQTIYEKAMTAVILDQHGEGKKAAEYVKSLKEYTVFTEEMGRYYDTRRASYSWYDYKIPTEVAAIEAIQRVTPNDQQTVDEMRRWLLQEKRTQAWDTPINSVNAIYAFLNGHSSQLTTNQPATVLAIDGSSIEAPASAGIGYVKTVVDGAAVNGVRTFTATKTSEGTSWGAVYAQFLQKTSDIEVSQSGITIKREVLTADGKKLTAESPLAVGQRIRIRITIESTRDLDFVQVVDRRAACMEPVRQLSGYQNGAYVSPKDYATCYFYGQLSKGKHQIETEYYIDRAGVYETGSCTVGCAYAPEYRATAPSMTFTVK